jgi:peptide/nickel transport system permease protein
MSILVFGIMRLIPGDAVDMMMDRMTMEQQEEMRSLFGLDDPLPVQYYRWMRQVVQGNLGTSIRSGNPVVQEIGVVLPATVQLGILGALLGILIGLPVGIIAALRQDSLLDRSLRFLVYLGISLPEFWLGTLLILLLAIQIPLFPPGGYVSILEQPLQGLLHAFLPALVLGLIMSSFLARVVRSAMLEILRQDYMVVARSKGLSDRIVLYRHALRNAASPIVTLVGLQFAFLVSGSVIVEEVFLRPGLGRLLVRSIFQRDYAVVQGIALLFAIAFVTVNALVDVARGYLDPRLRSQ